MMSLSTKPGKTSQPGAVTLNDYQSHRAPQVPKLSTPMTHVHGVEVQQSDWTPPHLVEAAPHVKLPLQGNDQAAYGSRRLLGFT